METDIEETCEKIIIQNVNERFGYIYSSLLKF